MFSIVALGAKKHILSKNNKECPVPYWYDEVTCILKTFSRFLEGRRADRGCCAKFWPSTVYSIFQVGNIIPVPSTVEELQWLTCFGWCRRTFRDVFGVSLKAGLILSLCSLFLWIQLQEEYHHLHRLCVDLNIKIKNSHPVHPPSGAQLRLV